MQGSKYNLFCWLIFIFIWAMIPVLEFWPIYFSNSMFSHVDFLHHVFAIRSYFFDLFKNQELSFLFPDNLLGTSVVANPVYAVYYPLNILYFAFSSISVMKISTVVHYVVLGGGWTLCLYLITSNRLASFLAATVFVCSGLVWSFHVRPQDLGATAWTGWTVYYYLLATRRNKLLVSLLAGVFAGFSFLGGDPLTGVLMIFMGFILSFLSRDAFQKEDYLLASRHLMAVLAGFLVTISPVAIQGWYLYPLSSRSFGYALQESLSYSTHLYRIIDVLFPWYLPSLGSAQYPWPEIRYGIADEWWYYSLALGVTAAIFLISGLGKYLKSWGGKILTILSLLILLGSLGHSLPYGDWLWTHVFPLTEMRFPERLLRYIALLLMPALGFGYQYWLNRLGRFAWGKWLILASLIVTMLEINLSLPTTIIGPTSLLQPLPEFWEIRKQRDNDPANPPRFIFCNRYFPYKDEQNKQRFMNFEIRGWRLSDGFALEAAESVMVKSLNCIWALNPQITDWLGISHVVVNSAFVSTIKEVLDLSGFEKIAENDKLNYIIYRTKQSAPSLAMYSSEFRLGKFFRMNYQRGKVYNFIDVADGVKMMKEWKLLIDPDWMLSVNGIPRSIDKETLDKIEQFSNINRNDPNCIHNHGKIPLKMAPTLDVIDFEYDFTCPTLLTMPWSFIPGWHLKINDQERSILRIGETTLGVLVPAGKTKGHLYFEPPGFVISAAISGFAVVFIICFSLSYLLRKRFKV